MNRRTAVAVLLASLCLATSIALAVTDLLAPPPSGGGPVTPVEIVPVALFLWGTPLLGLLVAVRRPKNPIGWLLMVTALGWALGFLVDDVAHGNARPELAGPLAIVQQLSVIGFLGLALLLMYFPNGSLPSIRWRVLPAAGVVGAITGALAGLFSPGSVVDDPPVPDLVNPFSQPAWTPVLGFLETISQLAFVVVIAGAVLLLVTRARRSTGIERQQLKWFVSAGALSALLFASALVVGTVAPDALLGTLLWALGLSSLFLVPLSAAVAILRYRLYEIDRIVSRTISYALVSATLAAVFGAANLVLQSALAPLTAGENPIAIAASTLVVFALIAPVRRRIAVLIDRRFNRSRYDAEQTIGRLTARLRDETDLALLADEVEQTVRQALRPGIIAVWTRE